MKLILLITSILIFSSVQSQNECNERLKKEVANISTLEYSSGTGFFINPTMLVTNKHVIQHAKEIYITININNKPKQVKAELLIYGKNLDIAVLEVKLPKGVTNNNFFKIANKKPSLGEKVYVLGYPSPDILGSNIKLTEGIINSTTGFADDTSLYQISAPIQPGNSGSPLLNNKKEVVGIVVSSYTNGQLVNYAIKTKELIALIKNYNLYNKNKIQTTISKGSTVSTIYSQVDFNKVSQISCTATKTYFTESDVFHKEKPKDWMFTNGCDDLIFFNFCSKKLENLDLIKDDWEKAIIFSYYNKYRIKEKDSESIGFGFYNILFNVSAYQNIVELVESEFPATDVLSGKMNEVALEMYMFGVYPSYWESYCKLYTRWEESKIISFVNYSLNLKNLLSSNPNNYHLLPEVYIALGNIFVNGYGSVQKRLLKQLFIDFEVDVKAGKIEADTLDDFKEYL